MSMTEPEPKPEKPEYLLACPMCKSEVRVVVGQVDVECVACAWHGPWLACTMDMMVAAKEIATTRHDIALLRAENVRLTNENNKLKRIERAHKRITRQQRG